MVTTSVNDNDTKNGQVVFSLFYLLRELHTTKENAEILGRPYLALNQKEA